MKGETTISLEEFTNHLRQVFGQYSHEKELPDTGITIEELQGFCGHETD